MLSVIVQVTAYAYPKIFEISQSTDLGELVSRVTEDRRDPAAIVVRIDGILMLISGVRLQIAFQYATGQGAWESTQALLKFARSAPTSVRGWRHCGQRDGC